MLLLFTEWYIIFNRNNKKAEDISIARPREVKLEYGTVYLHNFAPAVATQLTEYLHKFSANSIETSEPKEETTNETVSSSFELTGKAVGVSLNKTTNQTQVVVVGYNTDTKEAKVDSVYVADGKQDATNKFKQTSVELGFII